MSQGPTGHRPGGLTALAVLNFVIGGLYALLALLLLGGLALMNAAVNSANAAGGRVSLNDAPVPIMALIYVALLLTVLNALLLIASGVGYLGQKRFLGKTLGSVYGILGIVGTLVGFIGSKQFGLGEIIGLIYPVLTLVLLNTVFKDDFPNP